MRKIDASREGWPRGVLERVAIGPPVRRNHQEVELTGLGRTGRSAIFAMGSVTAQRWFEDDAMQRTARHILEQLDEPTFRFLLPWDEQTPLPAEWQVEAEMLDGDSLTSWLGAYWEGRYRGYW